MRTQGMADDWLAGIVLQQKVLQLISPTSLVISRILHGDFGPIFGPLISLIINESIENSLS